MAGRKIRDEADARACMAAARAARGMTQTEWAREHGIDGRSLFAWSKNLCRGERSGRRRKTAAPGRMVELVPSDAAEGAAPRYVVRFGDMALELGDDFNDEAVGRLVRVLKAC